MSKSTGTKIGFFPIGRIHFDREAASQISNQMYYHLISLGIQVAGTPNVLWNRSEIVKVLPVISQANPDLVLILQTTFTDTSLLCEIVDNFKGPFAIWAVPEPWTGERLRLNSFTGLNLAVHALKKRNIKYYTFVENQDSERELNKLQSIARAIHAIRSLKGESIGILGDPPAGFETCEYDETQVEETFGVSIKQFDLQEIFREIKSVKSDRINAYLNELTLRIKHLDKLDQEPLSKTIASALTFLDLQQRYQLRGLAVRCWPEFFTDLGCSACGALALSNHAGLPNTCEADIYGLITQIILEDLSRHAAVGVDMVGFDQQENTAALWHCGLAPLSMANPNYPIEGTVHSNRKLPLLLQFPFKPGHVTLSRFSQAGNRLSLVIGEGDMLDRPRPFSGTCGVIQFSSGSAKVLSTILESGLEHHISFTYGNIKEELEVIADYLEIPVVHL